ncbi:hypothetical protein [Streptomyces sp. NPDC059247]|uniref:hypothetical protein n=1 Tax=Streptomyces sp. NPDC059247 TaxID=3346790 RepID=UPI0036B4E4CF
MEDGVGEGEDPLMRVEVYGVLEQHPWIGQVSVDHDLEEDMFSLAVKRSKAYGWSSTVLGAGNELGGRRWTLADAGGDWSQDGQVRQLAWLSVYPADDLAAQHLPVMPMTRVLTDVLQRVGELRLAGLRVQVPVRLARDAGFDLRAAADWFALASPDARADVTVTVSAGPEVSAAQVLDVAARCGHGLLRLQEAGPGSPDIVLEGTCPEWTSDAAAWIADIIVESLRAAGVRAPAEITVFHNAEPGVRAER